ncbi:XRE family transcriptional regulator [Alishewanella sp. HL-SH06]|uniref:XRE family transcriptional regulator n=1 Tax=Alishewanella sp. HL-SH06 TaxID=3461144 RepID=UPI004042D7A1
MSVGKRVREARKQAGFSQQDLADKIGVKQPTLSELERGISSSSTHLITIAKVLGVSPDWLQTGKASSSYSEITDIKSSYTLGSFDTWDSKTPLSEDEVEIPFYKEVELSAGNGSIVQRESSGFKLRFAKSTLRRYNIQPDMAACVVVSGNSMEPVLPDQATVGIDTANTKIKDGDMYAIDHSGMLRVKVLYRLPGGGIRLRSFNRDEYPDEDCSTEQASEVKVLGRVFWYSVLR